MIPESRMRRCSISIACGCRMGEDPPHLYRITSSLTCPFTSTSPSRFSLAYVVRWRGA